MEILLLPIGIVMLILGWRFAFGSRKKRIQQKMDIQKLEIYETAQRKLEQFKNTKDLDGIISYLHYSGPFDGSIRKDAALALCERKDSRAIVPLISTIRELQSEDGGTTFAAIRALEKIGQPAVEPLITALREEHLVSNVRKSIIETFGRLRDFGAVEPLIALLKDENRDVRKSAEKALRKITDNNLGADLSKWQTWWQQNKKEFLKGR